VVDSVEVSDQEVVEEDQEAVSEDAVVDADAELVAARKTQKNGFQ